MNPQSVLTSQKTPGTANYKQEEFSLDEVRKHNNNQDAWTAVNGRVYDITKFLYQHPGGYSVISRAMGIDGTAVFREGHGMTNSESFLKRF
jgi:cytochrome b involved in lipid metabolism